MITCTKCDRTNPDDASFCAGCGQPLARVCPSCARTNDADARFCNGCGTALGGDADGGVETAAVPISERLGSEPRRYTPKHLADKILKDKSALEGERKQVTVLFADVKGSMDLAERLDAELWHQLLDRFFQILTEGVHRFEGTVNQYTGDGIMALFGAPIAHEDHAQRACYAALELRQRLREYADEVRRKHGVSFFARMGINSGEVIVGTIGDDLRMDYTAQGHTVGLAQRMESLAEPGAVFLTAHSERLVEGYFDLRSLGEFDLKGVAEPVEVFELEGIGTVRTRLDRSRSRGFSRFIGREQEFATLDNALQQALAGDGRVVGVVADAGVGKSRLCAEFLERCRAKGITVFEAHCPPHGRTVHLLPIFELMRSVFGIVEGDSDQAVREKVAGRLLLLDRDFEETLPLVWEFLGAADPDRPAPELDAPTRKRQLHEFVRRLVHARSEREPGVLLIDDLHWIDPGSDGFIAQIVDAAASTRSLILLNFRPEYRAEWMQRSHYHQLPLATLGDDDIRALAADLVGADASVTRLPDAVATRAGGNPFFAEEIVQSLAESGQLEGDRGAYQLSEPLDAISVPDTVQAILAARIDRLGEREKRVLQSAAVAGREFHEWILEAVVELSKDELHAALSTLASAEFLYQQALYPEPEYSFKHPLTHEVAYRSQLAERRRPLHAAAAQAIEARDPQKANEKASLLAYHWEAADEIEPAAAWHRKAAVAIGLIDIGETIRHWLCVRDLVDRLPPSPEQAARASEARAQILWSETRGAAVLDDDEVRKVFEEACELGERSNDPRSVPRAQATYANFLLYRGYEREALDLSERAVEEADRVGNPDIMVMARWSRAVGSWGRGDHEEVLETATRAIELSENDPSVGTDLLTFRPHFFFRGMRVGSLSYMGRRAEAAKDAAAFDSKESGLDRYSFYMPMSWLVIYHWLTGDFRNGLAAILRAREELRDYAVPPAEVFHCQMLGIAHTLVEEWQEAKSALEQSLAISIEHRAFLQQAGETSAWLARVYAELGEFDKAREAAAESERAGKRIGSIRTTSMLHFARARTAWKSGGTAARDEIERELAAGLRAAQDVGARLLEPYFHLEWATLYGACGEAERSREQLERAHALFVSMDSERNAERVARRLEAASA